MRAIAIVLCLTATASACSAASSRKASLQPEVPSVAVADSVPAKVLLGRGAEALRKEQWAEAAELLSAAHRRAPEGEIRSQTAFFWGYALYKQAEALARQNTSVDPAVTKQVVELMEQSRTILQGTQHPMRERVLSATDQYLVRIANRVS